MRFKGSEHNEVWVVKYTAATVDYSTIFLTFIKTYT
jgi:hypothetical protein